MLLFTGKGGVGKSTLAAATAVAAAGSGHRTLVLSTDAAHSLTDALGITSADCSAQPLEVSENLFVEQLDAQRRFEDSWADVQRYLLRVLDAAGVDAIHAEELAVLPGAEEVLALLELRSQASSGDWDVVVVDCAPTAETLRLLALPEALGWYMERVFPVERRIVKALGPVLSRATGVPMPEDDVFAAIHRLHDELDDVHALLTSANSSVRIVLTPESVVLAEARRSLTSLSLFGYRVDGVIANRVFPTGGDTWRDGWVAAQSRVLQEVSDSFAAMPVWRSLYRAAEPVGVGALREMADDVYRGDDPLALHGGGSPLSVVRHGDYSVLGLRLPNVSTPDVDLVRRGDELVVTVGSYRRLLTLPPGLARHQVVGARVADGSLQVRFRQPGEPDARSTGET